MIKILFIAPLSANGGIASWAKSYIHYLNDNHYKLHPIDCSSRHRTPNDTSIFKRIFWGLYDLIPLITKINKAFKCEKFNIMHIATSGSIGSFRDIIVGYICKRLQCKIILHCHYGCITDNVQNSGIIGWLTKTALKIYDQIWVLDEKSLFFLNHIPELKNKIYLTPNPIKVAWPKDLSEKKFNTIAFIGNLIPAKGIFELVEAVKQCGDVRLDIIGPGTSDVISTIRNIAGDNLNNRIFLHGFVHNDKALEILKGIDIVALPTYYPFEAFPISILEAMSLTKLVISTNRAAIPDILTLSDGSKCGIIVQEKSVDEIVKAIKFCQNFPSEANHMCRNAYDKVKNTYAIEIVNEIYKTNYNNLINYNIK